MYEVLKEATVIYQEEKRPIINHPSKAHAYLHRRIALREKEHLVMMSLNVRNILLHTDVVSVGSVNASIVDPREIFRLALRRNASCIVLAHNHPSGDPTPSEEDLIITRRLNKAGRLIGIALVDHIIITRRGYTSLRSYEPTAFSQRKEEESDEV